MSSFRGHGHHLLQSVVFLRKFTLLSHDDLAEDHGAIRRPALISDVVVGLAAAIRNELLAESCRAYLGRRRGGIYSLTKPLIASVDRSGLSRVIRVS